jgi:hypothetical protein
MIQRDPSSYRFLTEEVRREYGKKGKKSIERMLNKSKNAIVDTSYRIFDREKAEAVGALALFYSLGLRKLLNRGGASDSQKYKWLGEHYGEIFDAGVEMPDPHFYSRPLNGNLIVLNIVPRDDYFEGVVRMYEKAAYPSDPAHRLITPHDSIDLKFEDYIVGAAMGVGVTRRSIAIEMKR